MIEDNSTATGRALGRPRNSLSVSGDPAMDELFSAIEDTGITDRALEKRVGLARGAMSKYRRGVQPTLATFRAMANAIGLDLKIVRFK